MFIYAFFAYVFLLNNLSLTIYRYIYMTIIALCIFSLACIYMCLNIKFWVNIVRLILKKIIRRNKFLNIIYENGLKPKKPRNRTA